MLSIITPQRVSIITNIRMIFEKYTDISLNQKKLPELCQTAKFLCSVAWKSTYFRHCGTLYLLH